MENTSATVDEEKETSKSPASKTTVGLLLLLIVAAVVFALSTGWFLSKRGSVALVATPSSNTQSDATPLPDLVTPKTFTSDAMGISFQYDPVADADAEILADPDATKLVPKSALYVNLLYPGYSIQIRRYKDSSLEEIEKAIQIDAQKLLAPGKKYLREVAAASDNEEQKQNILSSISAIDSGIKDGTYNSFANVTLLERKAKKGVFITEFHESYTDNFGVITINLLQQANDVLEIRSVGTDELFIPDLLETLKIQ